VTFHRPIAVTERDDGFAVAGRPADCVKVGLHSLIDGPVDLVISGMNSGANVGINVLYSGTVGAAREATFNGVPGIAVSLHIGRWDHEHWDRAAGHARRAIDAALAGPMNPQTVININVPVLDDGAEPTGMAVAPASLSPMVVDYEQGHDEAGRRTFRICNTMTFAEREVGTDVAALYDRRVTITPLQFDTTCPATLPAWRQAVGGES
jgi:5'-nucleotidase